MPVRLAAVPADIDAGYVLARLDHAGETLMRLPGRGIFPSPIRSSWPDYRELPDKARSRNDNLNTASRAAEAQRPQPPFSRDVSAMDEVYLIWLPLLPSRTPHDLRAKRFVQLRSLVWPGSEREDPHVWSFRRLGDRFGLNHRTVAIHHARAVDKLVMALRRTPPTCVETLKRIRDHEIAQKQYRFPALGGNDL